jgi:hypothetical protein
VNESLLREFFGMKPRQSKHIIEIDMGEHDMLILTTPKQLSMETADRIKEYVEAALKKPGRVSLVLADGMQARVIHRPAP